MRAHLLVSEKRDQQRAQQLRIAALRTGLANGKQAQLHKPDGRVRELLMYIGVGLVAVLGVVASTVWLIIRIPD
jgi:hypothetical protein